MTSSSECSIARSALAYLTWPEHILANKADVQTALGVPDSDRERDDDLVMTDAEYEHALEEQWLAWYKRPAFQGMNYDVEFDRNTFSRDRATCITSQPVPPRSQS